MPTPRNEFKHHVLMLYRRGQLATIAEGAVMATVRRQTVARWLREAGIDIALTRGRFLIMLRKRAQRIAEGKPPLRRRTKAEWRQIGEKAVADFNRAAGS